MNYGRTNRNPRDYFDPSYGKPYQKEYSNSRVGVRKWRGRFQVAYYATETRKNNRYDFSCYYGVGTRCFSEEKGPKAAVGPFVPGGPKPAFTPVNNPSPPLDFRWGPGRVHGFRTGAKPTASKFGGARAPSAGFKQAARPAEARPRDLPAYGMRGRPAVEGISVEEVQERHARYRQALSRTEFQKPAVHVKLDQPPAYSPAHIHCFYRYEPALNKVVFDEDSIPGQMEAIGYPFWLAPTEEEYAQHFPSWLAFNVPRITRS